MMKGSLSWKLHLIRTYLACFSPPQARCSSPPHSPLEVLEHLVEMLARSVLTKCNWEISTFIASNTYIGYANIDQLQQLLYSPIPLVTGNVHSGYTLHGDEIYAVHTCCMDFLCGRVRVSASTQILLKTACHWAWSELGRTKQDFEQRMDPNTSLSGPT